MKEIANIPLNADHFEWLCDAAASHVVVQHLKPKTPEDHCKLKDTLIGALINYQSGSLQWCSRTVSWRITNVGNVATLVVSVGE